MKYKYILAVVLYSHIHNLLTNICDCTRKSYFYNNNWFINMWDCTPNLYFYNHNFSLMFGTVPEIEHNNKLQPSTCLFTYPWQMHFNRLTSNPPFGKIISNCDTLRTTVVKRPIKTRLLYELQHYNKDTGLQISHDDNAIYGSIIYLVLDEWLL